LQAVSVEALVVLSSAELGSSIRAAERYGIKRSISFPSSGSNCNPWRFENSTHKTLSLQTSMTIIILG
jgi:hypothetical protein